MSPDMATALKQTYGYVPADDEKWIVWADKGLIVCHADRLPRIYHRDCKGKYEEISCDLNPIRSNE